MTQSVGSIVNIYDPDKLLEEFENDLRRSRQARLRVRSESPAPIRGRETPALRMFAQQRRSPVHSVVLPGSMPAPAPGTEGGALVASSSGSLHSQPAPPPPPHHEPYHHGHGHGGGSSPRPQWVSPTARGLAPAPTDQPIRAPATEGIEADVDQATIDLVRRMETGHGAAGDYVCCTCYQPIGKGRPGCSALDKTYHIECFTCAVCHTRLAGGSFYSVDGKPYCEKDYKDTLDKCESCGKPILDRILRASGKPFHPACFTCTACKKSLDGIPFTVDSNNAIHCVDCFHDKYAPRCARCSKPIVPEDGKEESLRVVAMDKSFHVDCYRCEDCNKSLNSKIDGHGCYPLDDHLLCKECNMARVTAGKK